MLRIHGKYTIGLLLIFCSFLKVIFASPGDMLIETKEHYVPADKNLSPEWLAALHERGDRKIYRGEELYTIGMPCGGICAGQLYVRGDGTLARWWIFNEFHNTHFRRKVPNTGYTTYRPPSEIEQGFAVYAKQAGGKPVVLELSENGFEDIGFIGEYPVATIQYEGPKDSRFPLKVQSEVFSPYIPTNTRESATPATILHYMVTNPGSEKVEVALGGWLQNAPMPNAHKDVQALRRNSLAKKGRMKGIYFDLVPFAEEDGSVGRIIKVFEDFESPVELPDGTFSRSGSYSNWIIEGDGFGQFAAHSKELPRTYKNYQGEHAAYSRRGGRTGKLISKPFIIKDDYIGFMIAGHKLPYGSKNAACIILVVDGQVVRSATGHNNEMFCLASWNVGEFIGKKARIEIIDKHKDRQIGVDYIHFSNRKPRETAMFPSQDRHFGNMFLGVLDIEAVGLVDWESKQHFLNSLTPELNASQEETRFPMTEKRCGGLVSNFILDPGQTRTVTFVVSWYFPNFFEGRGGCPGDVGRMYTNWYSNAMDAAEFIADNFPRLYRTTSVFRDTLYLDTTLPYWFVQRSAMSSSVLASETVEWWKNGRFYSSEGVGFCHGTCGHVWNYAQSPARLFPELERSVRTMQDFNGHVAFKNTGRINFRGFNDRSESFLNWGYIPDAQAGYVLKAYREHLMTADNKYLNELWPKIKKATEYLIERDGRFGPTNGILEGLQHLTDSLGWGANTFTGSFYLAALRASEEMARLQNDPTFAKICRQLYEDGQSWTLENLWNGEYFIHQYEKPPEGEMPIYGHGHKDGRSFGDGCLADQMMGQNWAHQLGLGYIYPKSYVDQSLKSVFKYNWTPDVATVYKVMTQRFILLANEGEPGMIGITYPKSPPPENQIKQNDDPWTGYEYQVASGMIWEGLLTEGLSIAYGVHQRYDGKKHNPWNEIEGGDHYSRSMSAWGMLLAAGGYIYDGPAGKIGFAPRMNPDNFKSVFTSAQSWGSIAQQRDDFMQTNTIKIKWGQLYVKTLLFEVPDGEIINDVKVEVSGVPVNYQIKCEGKHVIIDLEERQVLQSGQIIQVNLTW